MPKMTAYAKAHGLKDEIDVIELFDEWDDVSSKFSDQDAESCCAKFKSMHAEKRRQHYSKQLTTLATKRKELAVMSKSIREEIAKKDVSSAPSVAAIAASDDVVLKKQEADLWQE